MIFASLLILLVSVYCDVARDPLMSKDLVIGKEIDYGVLAGQAEIHKEDVLAFLNQTEVQEKYKKLYQCLLDKLLSKYLRVQKHRLTCLSV